MIFVLIPVVLVVSVGVASNRSLGEIVRAAIGSAAIAYGGLIAFVIYFFLTVPDGFFN